MSSTNGGRQRRPGQAHDEPASHPPGFRPTKRDLEGSFSRLLSATEAALAELPDDPLLVELLISEISAPWSGPFPDEVAASPEVVIGQGFIEHTERSNTPAALVILRGLAALGTDRQRAKAAAAADRLAAGGIPEPAWVGELSSSLRATGCWVYGDVYGDQTHVVLGFERAGRRHSVVVLAEHNMGEIATECFLGGGQEQVLAAIAADVQQQRMRLHAIDPAAARGIVEAALANTDLTFDPPVGKTFWFTRSLVLSRLQALPRAQPQRVELTPTQRAEIVTDFLASPHAAGLADRAVAQRCAALIVDHSCAYDEGRARRVSPMKSQVFLLAWVPLKAVLSDPELAAMPAVVAAWVRWAGELNGLPDWAQDELDRTVADLGTKFPAAYADPYRAGPAKSWVAGPGEDVPGFNEVRAVIDRRTFAMPYVGTRIGDKDYPELDASDENQRWLLIFGEHPEYHEMFGDSDPDATALSDTALSETALIDALGSQAHLITHAIVATQLWHDDPPEAWQAAQRLTAAGVERHEVLHLLGDVVTQHVFEGVPEQELAANESYRCNLNALGQAASTLPREGSDQ